MATTKITPVHQTMIKSINYIVNPEKTDGGEFIHALNCPSDPAKCFGVMMQTKRQFQNTDGVQGHMLHLNFKPHELGEKKALQIATEFAERYLGKDYEVLIGVHNDKEHIHAHILFNNVSFNDGAKYRSNIGNYYNGIRKLADELCAAHGLSIPIPKQKKAQHYFEWKAAQEGWKTWKDLARHDIDIAIQKSVSFPDFLIQIERMGYDVNNDPNRKHITVQPLGSEKRIRLNNLGNRYSEEAIKNRIADCINHFTPSKKRTKRTRVFVYSKQRPHIKMTRFQALYLKYKYQLGMISRSNKIKKRHIPLKEDVKNYNQHLNAYRFIASHKITSLQAVKNLQAEAYQQRNTIKTKIERIQETERAYRTDFRLLSEYHRLKTGMTLIEQKKADLPSVQKEYENICFALSKRGYDNESKLSALSEKKAEIMEAKETIKEAKNEVRQILRHCKNVLQSYEKIRDVSTRVKAISESQKEKQVSKQKTKDRQR